MSNISNSTANASLIEALAIELEILDVIYNTLNALEAFHGRRKAVQEVSLLIDQFRWLEIVASMAFPSFQSGGWG